MARLVLTQGNEMDSVTAHMISLATVCVTVGFTFGVVVGALTFTWLSRKSESAPMAANNDQFNPGRPMKLARMDVRDSSFFQKTSQMSLGRNIK